MLSKNPNQKVIQQNLFAPTWVQIINPKHELITLAHELDWIHLSNFFKKYDSKKGKKGKKYEYGRKISVIKTVKNGIIVGVKGYDGTPHDSKTLESALEQARQIMGKEIGHASVDRGYQGQKQIEETEIHIPNLKGDRKLSVYQKRKKRKRLSNES